MGSVYEGCSSFRSSLPNLKIEHNTTLQPALQCYDTPVLTGGVYCVPADQLDHKEAKNKRHFMCDILRLAGERCFGEGSQASLFSPSGNSNIKMKRSMEQKGNDTRGGKLKSWENTLS